MACLRRFYRSKNEELAPEFRLARAVIDARVTAGLSQEQLAERMDTTQSVIARPESGGPGRRVVDWNSEFGSPRICTFPAFHASLRLIGNPLAA